MFVCPHCDTRLDVINQVVVACGCEQSIMEERIRIETNKKLVRERAERKAAIKKKG